MAERPKVKRRPLSGRNGTTPVSLYGKDSIFAPSNRHAFSLFFGRIIAVPFGTKTVLSARYAALRHVCRLSAAQSNILIRMHPIPRISVHRKKILLPPSKNPCAKTAPLRSKPRHTWSNKPLGNPHFDSSRLYTAYTSLAIRSIENSCCAFFCPAQANVCLYSELFISSARILLNPSTSST